MFLFDSIITKVPVYNMSPLFQIMACHRAAGSRPGHVWNTIRLLYQRIYASLGPNELIDSRISFAEPYTDMDYYFVIMWLEKPWTTSW